MNSKTADGKKKVQKHEHLVNKKSFYSIMKGTFHSILKAFFGETH